MEQFKIVNNIIIDVDKDIKELIIPEGIREIGNKELFIENEIFDVSALYGCDKIEYCYIPSTIEKINNNIFCSLLLNKVEVSEDNKFYTSIDGVLFNKDMTKLIYYPIAKLGSEYCVPSTVLSLEENSINSIYLETIILLDGLETIKSSAFAYCVNLNTINIGRDVSKIGYDIFEGCNNLSNIIVDEQNKYYKSVDGVLFNKDKDILIKYPSNKKEEMYIVNNVKVIESNAFISCNNLKEVIMNEGLEMICSRNFIKKCLSKIKLPSTLKIIEEEVFTILSNLEEINVDCNSNSFTVIDNVLFTKNLDTLIIYPSNKKDVKYIIPEKVKFIESNAFYFNEYLEEIIANSKLEYIGDPNFMFLKRLKNIKLSNVTNEVNKVALDLYNGKINIYNK